MIMPAALIPHPAQEAPLPHAARPGTPVAVPSPPRRSQVPRLAAAVAVVAGVINLVSALLPAERARLHLLAMMVPGAVSRGATVAVAAAGVGLLLLAGGLRRRHRAAWLATVGLLAGSAVLHVVKGLDVEEALIEAFLAGLLSGQGDSFPGRAARGERPGVLGPALTVAAATFAYGTLGLIVNDRDVRADLGLGGMVAQVGRMATGLGSGVPLAGRFGRLFPASVAAVFYVGLLIVAARALAPALVRRSADPGRGRGRGRIGRLAGLLRPPRRPDHRPGRRRPDRLRPGRVRSPWPAATRWGRRPSGPAAIAAFLDRAAAPGPHRGRARLAGEAAAEAWRAGRPVQRVYLGDEAVLDLDRVQPRGSGAGRDRPPELEPGPAGPATAPGRAVPATSTPAQAAALAELSRHAGGAAPTSAASRWPSAGCSTSRDPEERVVVAATDSQGKLRGVPALRALGRRRRAAWT